MECGAIVRPSAGNPFTAITLDITALISLFLDDHDAARFWSTCRDMRYLSFIDAVWKARAFVYFQPIMSPRMVTGFSSGDERSWRDRYRLVRQSHPSGVVISADLLSWFDVSDLNLQASLQPTPPGQAATTDDEDGEVVVGSDAMPTSNIHLLQRIFGMIRNNPHLGALPRPIRVHTPIIDRQRLRIYRPRTLDESDSDDEDLIIPGHPLGPMDHGEVVATTDEPANSFLHGRPVSVRRLMPSIERAREWARLHCRNPIRKLARFHRWGMFWLQLEHDDMSFRANQPFPRPPIPNVNSRATLSYFECTVARQPNAVGIGISDQQFQSSTPGVFVGWPSGTGTSYGYHGDDGLKFNNDGRGQAYSTPYSKGDVIGCGLDWATGTVFFTKNGTYLGPAFIGVDTNPDKQWYPTLSLKHVLSRRTSLHPNAFRVDQSVFEGNDVEIRSHHEDQHPNFVGEELNDEHTDAVIFNSGTHRIAFVYDLDSYPVAGSNIHSNPL